jgi:hypothetical protein
MHVLRSQWLGLVLLFGLLVSPLAAPKLLYACSMTGRLGPACCCGGQSRAQAPDGPSVDRSSCCRAEAPERHLGSAVEKAGSFGVAHGTPQPTTELIVVHRPSLRPHQPSMRARSRAPPPIGPPLYILHRSFLS